MNKLALPQNSDVQYIYYLQKNGATFIKAKCVKGILLWKRSKS